ncbi:MAG: preprotein translocase subunit SecA [Candidatus Wildermuthbacteria bacterium]|nr:preprotein translocase subunit SecA [Candidatus Wildermuthbacteria bacterium]
MNIGKMIFGDYAEKYLRSKKAAGEIINQKEPELQRCSSEDFKKKTAELKARLLAGETLESILADAFALVREAGRRVLNQRHFDVQMLGGMVLHEGKIAEMKTGEGKTLTATLPAYLNALEGKGAHVITVNDYLAKRDAVWMGQIYDFLGLSVACVLHDASYIYDASYRQGSLEDAERDATGGFKVEDVYLRPVSRKEAYAADITYGTNNEFGFDYLRDNMAQEIAFQVQRGHHFAIVDEIDSILIDEARTPLIISAPDQESSSWYGEFSALIPKLEKDMDYTVDEKLKAVSLTEQGIDKIERLTGVKDIYQERGIKFLHHVEQGLKAHVLFEKDRDYVVRSGQVIIVDEFTGRMLPGRRYSGGLHQALEAKEGVQVQPESITLASITFQNYFRMYKKLSGMTGTALTSAEEFSKVYGLEVISVPTNKTMVRKDFSDRIYQTNQAKFRAIVKEVAEAHKKGQPVLVGTVSIQKNEYISELLKREGIPHEVLNAKYHEKEGMIIAQAGKKGHVTVATNMAGRGVDIVLGGNPRDEKEAQEVKELGGLHIIGTERHEARRIDNQLRGRAGRQGDPGSTQFFVSLEDDLIRIFGGDRMASIMRQLRLPEDEAIESGMVSRAIESAQSKIEGFHFDSRKHLLEYDDVLNKHRETVYRKRKEILERAARGALKAYLLGVFAERGRKPEEYEVKEKELGVEGMQVFSRAAALRAIDFLWVEHLENMEALRDSVKLRAYGQQDPLIEYKNEGRQMFGLLLQNMEEMMIKLLLDTPAGTHAHASVAQSLVPQNKVIYERAGRNDPCPCGSGKKFKKCHGA